MTLFADPAAFTLDEAQLIKRVAAMHGAAAARIIAPYKGKYPHLSAPDLNFLIWSDYPTMLFENLIAERRAARNQAPTYLYRFDWRSPVPGGRYRTPHAMEIPFVFDNTKVMASMTGGNVRGGRAGGENQRRVDRARHLRRSELRHSRSSQLQTLFTKRALDAAHQCRKPSGRRSRT